MSKQTVKKQKLIQPKEVTEQNSSSSVSIGLIGVDRQIKPKHIKAPKTLLENKIRQEEKKKNNSTPTLFDKLQEEHRDLLEHKGVLSNGLNLSIPEEKVIHAILTLLSEYDYKGNREPVRGKAIIPGEPRKENKVISVSSYELVKTYRGNKPYSSKVYKMILQTLLDLKQKIFPFYTSYFEGKKLTKERLSFVSLIAGVHIDAEKGKRVVTIEVDSSVLHNIESYFQSRPIDFYQQIEAASSPHKINSATTHLVEVLAAYASHSKAKTEKGDTIRRAIRLDGLYTKIQLQNYIKKRDYKKARKYLEQALEACKKAGALSSYEIKPGSTGDYTCYFVINKKCSLW